MGNIGMVVVGVRPTEQTNQTKEAISQQVTSQWGSPTMVMTIKTPW
jgi:hypothetical protein